jgi:methyl-accepting chemotaxis protein
MDSPICQQETDSVQASQNRRRRYIIKGSFQWRFIIGIAAIVFVTSTLVTSVVYGMLYQQARARPLDPPGYTLEVALAVIGCGAALSLVAAIGVGLWCVLATHRIYGPLYVLGLQFEELASGRLPKSRNLREGDEFKDLCQMFRAAIDSVRTRQQRALRLLTELTALAQTAVNAEDDQRKATVSEIARQLQYLEESISQTGCRD